MTARVSCAGVLRNEAGGSPCSLGPHCDALALIRDPDAYRGAHTRFSDPAAPSPDVSYAAPRRDGEGRSLLDTINDAMERLDRLNPPPD